MTADVSSNLYDWSTTASSNQPDGTDALSNLDDNLREIQAVLRGFLFSKGADIASAAEPDPKISGLVHEITGTTTVSGLATASAGMWKIFKFAANPLLKNSTAFALPGAADIQAATGDYCLAVSMTSTGIWNVPFYQRRTFASNVTAGAEGKVLRSDGSAPEWDDGINVGTATSTGSGTAANFTSIPSWVKRITLCFSGVSTNGTSTLLVQLGDSGGYETTGYVGAAVYSGTGVSPNGTVSSTGFQLDGFAAASNTRNGVAFLQNMGGNIWAFQAVISESAATNAAVSSGVKTLSATLDRLRVIATNGTDAFDAGSINIAYE